MTELRYVMTESYVLRDRINVYVRTELMYTYEQSYYILSDRVNTHVGTESYVLSDRVDTHVRTELLRTQ